MGGALIEVMCSIASKDQLPLLANESNESSQLAGNWGLCCSFLAWSCEPSTDVTVAQR